MTETGEKHKNLKDGIEKEWNSPVVKCVKRVFNGRHGLNGHNGLLYTIMPESPFCPSSPSSPSNAESKIYQLPEISSDKSS